MVKSGQEQSEALSILVDEATAEASIEAKNIGVKIRRLRLKRSMGLVELGQEVGLSASFLSQSWRQAGWFQPLRNLARIALVFKKDFSYFLGDETEAVFRVSRAKDRIRLPIGERADPFLLSESMSMLIPDRNAVPCIAQVSARGSKALPSIPHRPPAWSWFT